MYLRTPLWLGPSLLLAAIAPVAHAAPLTFDFILSGVDSGNITITETAGIISNITGTFDTETITSILPSGGGSIGVPDDLYFTTPPYLDGGGVSFSLAATDPDGYGFVNLSWNSELTGYFAEQSLTSANTGGHAFGPDTLTPSTVPEPGSASLALIALAMVFVVQIRRSGVTSAASRRS
jgi:hypothetical protein